MTSLILMRSKRLPDENVSVSTGTIVGLATAVVVLVYISVIVSRLRKRI